MALWAGRVGWLTIILGLCAVANVIIIGLQLHEMHSGGIDTHNLAIATADFASAMKRQAKNTSRLVAATEISAKAARDAAKAAQGQAAATVTTASEQFHAAKIEADSRRPVAAISVSISGFKDKPDKDGHVQTPLTVKFVNTGQGVMYPTGGRIRLLWVERTPEPTSRRFGISARKL